jgi:hypothetical protein
MNQILYENRCKCNEEFSITKNENQLLEAKGNHFNILNLMRSHQKHFKKIKKELSSTAKFILNSFQNKYIYYAMIFYIC